MLHLKTYRRPMNLEPRHFYHLYNRGNNRERIFFRDENYLYFLRKVRCHLLPHTRILAYCLMPNHVHFLIQVRDNADGKHLAAAYRTLLSSYTRAIQRQEHRTGSLFQQNSKAKDLQYGTGSYAFSCFCYIHQNPLRAGLVTNLAEWPYSSYRDYAGMRKGTLCDRSFASDVLDLPADASAFSKLIQLSIPDEIVSRVL